MIDKEIITKNEAENDGKTIYLYYDVSEAFQMPVALLRREHVLYLRQSLKIQEHTIRTFYRFTMRENVGQAGYQRWASGIQTRHGMVAKYT